MRRFFVLAISMVLLGSVVFGSANVAHAQWSTVFEAGVKDGPWRDNGSGVEFVHEGGPNDPPGDPDSPVEDGQADSDFYFAGTYPDPIGKVDDEVAFERAFGSGDNHLRIHFNLPDDLAKDQKFRFTFQPSSLEGDLPNARYGVEVMFNDKVILPKVMITLKKLGDPVVVANFSAADVGAKAGASDNVISLRGISMSEDGGGRWLGIQHYLLETRK